MWLTPVMTWEGESSVKYENFHLYKISVRGESYLGQWTWILNSNSSMKTGNLILHYSSKAKSALIYLVNFNACIKAFIIFRYSARGGDLTQDSGQCPDITIIILLLTTLQHQRGMENKRIWYKWSIWSASLIFLLEYGGSNRGDVDNFHTQSIH